jgi:hypothetical protein
MQHPNDSKNHARALCRAVWGVTFVVPLMLFGSASCAQGGSELTDDGGSDDASGGQDTASTPPADSGRPPTPDATGSSSSSGGQVDSAADTTAETGTSDTGAEVSEGGVDSAIDQHANTPETGAESGVGQEAGRDAVSDVVGPDGPSGCACGAQAVCVSGACTPARRVFVSSATYTGNLGGASGADTTCGTLAMQAGLGGSWMAWISDATTSPGQRFVKATVPYRMLDGTMLASSFGSLSAGISSAINIDEKGESLAGASSDGSKTWTGTLTSGAVDKSSCTGFTSASGTGEVGHCTSMGTVGWTSAYTSEMCSVANHIYCFEQ